MSTPEGRKSPKHERVTRATAAATAAAAASNVTTRATSVVEGRKE